MDFQFSYQFYKEQRTMKRYCLILLTIIIFSSSNKLYSKEKPQKNKVPPLSFNNIAGESCMGFYGGSIFMIGTMYIGYLVGNDNDIVTAVGASLGYLVGNPICVYMAGNRDNKTGSFWATLGGSLIGGVVPLIQLIRGSYGKLYPAYLLTCPLIGSIVGFNMTRRYTTEKTALINYKNKQLSFITPIISFRPNPYDNNDIIKSIDLVTAKF